MALAKRVLSRPQFRVLSMRFPLSGKAMTRPEVAEELNITLVRVRSLEALALANLKRIGGASRVKTAEK